MVIHRAKGGRGGPAPLRSFRTVPLAVVALLAGALSAQTPAEAAQQPAKVFGRIVAEQVQMRCFTGEVAAPPVFEEVLKKGQLVQLGRSENGFRSVILPLGPLGYVSQRFAAVAEDGTVATKGQKVAFRHRPRTTEAPVVQLPDATPILVVGEHEDWFRARVPGVEAWLAAAEVQEIGVGDDAIAAEWAKFEQDTRGEMQARLDAIAAANEQAKQARADLEAVGVVDAAFTQELQKPAGDQVLAPLLAELDKLDAKLTDGSEAKVASAALRKRITTRQWVVDALNLRDSVPPPVEALPPPPPKDRLERFEAIGWLRYQSRLGAPGVYYLEKGGRQQHVLTCNTRRYDLALFIDREIGVIGPRRQPPGDSLSQLDVERVEVLGVSPR